MRIVTLTLNPAFDMHCHIDDFQPFHENLAEITDFEAGGKGVNISRALTVNGVDNLAIVVLGDENGDTFSWSLMRDGIPFKEIVVPGRIRENITIHTDTADETRISFKGFATDNSLLRKVEKLLEPMLDEEICLTFTGRVPAGIDIQDVKAFLNRLRGRGAKIVVDSRSFTKADLIDVHAWLIKPNQEEISMYLDRNIDSFNDALAGARELCAAGIENVMVSLGSQGAMLVTADAAYTVSAPAVTVRSTIGAGDSSIAGFVAAAQMGKPASECLATAVAYGSAACETAGTRPPEKATVERLMHEIVVDRL